MQCVGRYRDHAPGAGSASYRAPQSKRGKGGLHRCGSDYEAGAEDPSQPGERMTSVRAQGPQTRGCRRWRTKGSVAGRARERRDRGRERGTWALEGHEAGWGAEQTLGCPPGVLRQRRMPCASSRRAQHLSPCVGLGLGPGRARPPCSLSCLPRAGPGCSRGSPRAGRGLAGRARRSSFV